MTDKSVAHAITFCPFCKSRNLIVVAESVKCGRCGQEFKVVQEDDIRRNVTVVD